MVHNSNFNQSWSKNAEQMLYLWLMLNIKFLSSALLHTTSGDNQLFYFICMFSYGFQ
jgi:hypothetical protein